MAADPLITSSEAPQKPARRRRKPPVAAVASPGLSEEIGYLRKMIRQVFACANDEADDLDEWAKALTSLAGACSRLAELLKTEQELDGSSDPLGDLQQALAETAAELEPPSLAVQDRSASQSGAPDQN